MQSRKASSEDNKLFIENITASALVENENWSENEA